MSDTPEVALVACEGCDATHEPHEHGCENASWSRLPRKYRKRPVVIDAWKVFAPSHTYADLRRVGCPVTLGPLGAGLWIETLEGEMQVRPGDYVIRGVQGEFYPCKADIFEQTYEAVPG